MENHETLRRGLDILDGMVGKMEGGDRIDIADAAAILNVFKSLAQDEEQRLVASIEKALHFRKGMDFVLNSRQFTVLLRDHLEREDIPVPDPDFEAAECFARIERKYVLTGRRTAPSRHQHMERGASAS